MGKIQDVQLILQKVGLQPGKHREMQSAIVELFGPHFTPDAIVLYIGDVGNKPVIHEKEMLEELGVPVTAQSKLPDAIFYDEVKHMLFLIEAVTSHGPVKPERLLELEGLLVNSSLKRVYISAFPNFDKYGHDITIIAWNTHVWLAEAPEHIIHFNGDKYIRQHG